jgi:hypothetical protein
MLDSIEQLVSFGTIFGGVLGLIPFSIARSQGKKQFATVALIACLLSGYSYGEKLALPVFTSLSIMAIVSGKASTQRSPQPEPVQIEFDS